MAGYAGARRRLSTDRVYLLDTNVVSELHRRKPHGGVVAWLESAPDEHLHLSAVTLGELQAGVEITREQDSPKAEAIEAWIDQVEQTWNVLAMDGRSCGVHPPPPPFRGRAGVGVERPWSRSPPENEVDAKQQAYLLVFSASPR